MHAFSILSWGLILQAAALVHFVRRRPDAIWLWIIILLGPLGALAYIVMEMAPDLGLLRQPFDALGRRKRIARLEAIVRDNPSAGNYEDLADLYLDHGDFARARDCYDRAISTRTDHPDPLYRRGIAHMQLGDADAAVRDFEAVAERDPKYDSRRAMGQLAHAYALTGRHEEAEGLFRQVTMLSTSSETYLNFATFLASRNRPDEAREWAQRILAKKPTMPRYLRRLERPWFRKAAALLERLPGGA